MAIQIPIVAAIIKGVSDIWSSWIEAKKAKHQAEIKLTEKSVELAEQWDVIALMLSRYSWKDEIIMLIVFSPLVVWWWAPAEATQWIEFVSSLPPWYVFLMFGITAASFGLRWFFNKQKLRITREGVRVGDEE